MRPATAQEPRLLGWRLRRSPTFVGILYATLALSAAAALLGAARPALGPPWARLGAAVAFGIFLTAFALYRVALVKAGRYPAGKAFFQLGAGALFLMILLAGARERADRPAPRSLPALMADRDPEIRALACELARYRPERRALVPALTERLGDPSALVRQAASESLEAISNAAEERRSLP